jgi:UDP-N-acetylglucosamine 2-epimerase (non-hydrolysing)
MRRVMVIYGTRPEAIKLAPIVEAMAAAETLRPVVVVTAQHREMLDQVNTLFGIVPDVDLDLLRPGQTLASLTNRILGGLMPVLERERPDAVVVQGDTTTTFVGALAAFYNRVPVVHVEAGLRTFDRYSPYPEEVNRRLTTALASLHLAPTATSRDNLLREGVDATSVVVTGNTIIDALLATVGRCVPYGDSSLEDLDADPRRVLLVTSHRRESWGPAMRGIGRALARLADDPNLLIVLPVHRNPVVREAILPPLARRANVLVVEPLSYGGFARLLNRASVILTDSGGIQEEGPSLGKPVLVMRNTTERPEAVAAGTSRLVGTEETHIVREVRRLLGDPAAYAAMSQAINPYGDGRAAARSLAAITALLDASMPLHALLPAARLGGGSVPKTVDSSPRG